MAKTNIENNDDLKSHVSNIVSNIKKKLNDPSSYHKGKDKPIIRGPEIRKSKGE